MFLNPEEILNQIDLRKNMVAADFGSGQGGFAIPLARRLESGLVYALDVQTAPLNALKNRANFEKVLNIKIIRCDLEKPRGSTLTDGSLDLILIVNLLFQASDKNAIISEAKRVLKERAKLLVIDWLPNVSAGPSEGKVPSEEVKKIAENLGFKLEKEIKAGAYHYALLFKK